MPGAGQPGGIGVAVLRGAAKQSLPQWSLVRGPAQGRKGPSLILGLVREATANERSERKSFKVKEQLGQDPRGMGEPG